MKHGVWTQLESLTSNQCLRLNMRIFYFHLILSSLGRRVLTKSLLILLFVVAKEALGNSQTTCSKLRDLIGLWTQITWMLSNRLLRALCRFSWVGLEPLQVLFSAPRDRTTGWKARRVSKFQLVTRLLLYAVKHDHPFTHKFRARSRLFKI